MCCSRKMKESHRMIWLKSIFRVRHIHYLQQVNHCNTINRQKFGFITKSLRPSMTGCSVWSSMYSIMSQNHYYSTLCYRAIELIEISFTRACTLYSVPSHRVLRVNGIAYKCILRSARVLCNGDSVSALKLMHSAQNEAVVSIGYCCCCFHSCRRRCRCRRI